MADDDETDAPKPEAKTLYLTILDDQDNVTGVMIVRSVPGDVRGRGRKEMVIFNSGHAEPTSVIFGPNDISTLIESLRE